MLFHLAQAGAIRLVVGPGILREADEVLRRKAPDLLATLAQLLDEVGILVRESPSSADRRKAESLLGYPPDAMVLAQAIRAKPDWFVSHDREHFLGNPSLEELAFRTGSPGDLLAWLKENAGDMD